MIHVYISHRLSGPDHADNIEAAGKIMCELADRLPIVPVGSWITLARYWDESKRDKGLAIDKEQISRADEFWAVGRIIGHSGGMKLESGWALEFNKPQMDLTGMTVDQIVEWWQLGK